MTGVVQRLRWLGLILLSLAGLTTGLADSLEAYDFGRSSLVPGTGGNLVHKSTKADDMESPVIRAVAVRPVLPGLSDA